MFSLLIHTVTSNGLVYACAADKENGRRIPYLFLDEVLYFTRLFNYEYSGSDIQLSVGYLILTFSVTSFKLNKYCCSIEIDFR